jgi:hypothetical protein
MPGKTNPYDFIPEILSCRISFSRYVCGFLHKHKSTLKIHHYREIEHVSTWQVRLMCGFALLSVIYFSMEFSAAARPPRFEMMLPSPRCREPVA